MKTPRLRKAIIRKIIPQQKVAWAAIFTASIDPASAPQVTTSCPVKRLTMATGPTPTTMDDPKKVYAADGMMAAYKPLMGG